MIRANYFYIVAFLSIHLCASEHMPFARQAISQEKQQAIVQYIDELFPESSQGSLTTNKVDIDNGWGYEWGDLSVNYGSPNLGLGVSDPVKKLLAAGDRLTQLEKWLIVKGLAYQGSGTIQALDVWQKRCLIGGVGFGIFLVISGLFVPDEEAQTKIVISGSALCAAGVGSIFVIEAAKAYAKKHYTKRSFKDVAAEFNDSQLQEIRNGYSALLSHSDSENTRCCVPSTRAYVAMRSEAPTYGNRQNSLLCGGAYSTASKLKMFDDALAQKGAV